ncbi:DUF3482 domain-containing protein [Moraxella oblonga]|uniref:GTPase/DUF3482 domain-containing protein n=1 Tax=Moraxella oblonga TaxID=200413 RepID=UPI0008378DCD|nr:DUF3482 domain-containing protein [Moraxella oblonga]
MKTIQLAIIGHTNTGKTSLMRTLLRNDEFGEVKNESATTRHVEAVTLYSTTKHPLVVLHDTPGLEDASGVMDYLHEHTDPRKDGVDRLQAFLEAVRTHSPKLHDDFSQEAKVVNALLHADVAIYVVDVREPILSKYQDELAILASSGVPVLPVFNFVKSDQQKADEWRQMLSRRALHVCHAFDTVAFDFEAEMLLWQYLHTLTHAQAFDILQHERRELWHELGEKGSFIIADTLINIASFSQKIAENTDPAPTLTLIQNAVRQVVRQTEQKLLSLYRFYHTDVVQLDLHIQSTTQDIFDRELLTRYGIRTAGGGMAGMIVGAGIDVATFGASLGLGTAIGGMLGGLLPNAQTIKDKATNVKTLHVDDATLTVIATQLQRLHHILRHRGHASLDTISTQTDQSIWQKIPTPLKKAKAYQHYSDIGSPNQSTQTLRAELSEALAMVLEKQL